MSDLFIGVLAYGVGAVCGFPPDIILSSVIAALMLRLVADMWRFGRG